MRFPWCCRSSVDCGGEMVFTNCPFDNTINDHSTHIQNQPLNSHMVHGNLSLPLQPRWESPPPPINSHPLAVERVFQPKAKSFAPNRPSLFQSLSRCSLQAWHELESNFLRTAWTARIAHPSDAHGLHHVLWPLPFQPTRPSHTPLWASMHIPLVFLVCLINIVVFLVHPDLRHHHRILYYPFRSMCHNAFQLRVLPLKPNPSIIASVCFGSCVREKPSVFHSTFLWKNSTDVRKKKADVFAVEHFTYQLFEIVNPVIWNAEDEIVLQCTPNAPNIAFHNKVESFLHMYRKHPTMIIDAFACMDL